MDDIGLVMQYMSVQAELQQKVSQLDQNEEDQATSEEIIKDQEHYQSLATKKLELEGELVDL